MAKMFAMAKFVLPQHVPTRIMFPTCGRGAGRMDVLPVDSDGNRVEPVEEQESSEESNSSSSEDEKTKKKKNKKQEKKKKKKEEKKKKKKQTRSSGDESEPLKRVKLSTPVSAVKPPPSPSPASGLSSSSLPPPSPSTSSTSFVFGPDESDLRGPIDRVVGNLVGQMRELREKNALLQDELDTVRLESIVQNKRLKHVEQYLTARDKQQVFFLSLTSYLFGFLRCSLAQPGIFLRRGPRVPTTVMRRRPLRPSPRFP
jgi:hypothetical protein